MTSLANALACVLVLGGASFLWRKNSGIFQNGISLALLLFLFCLFSFFAVDGESLKAAGELYPFRMMALCLCFSTTSLSKYRRRYLVLAQSLWLWIEMFGGISLYYRGIDVAWVRVAALAGITFCSNFLSKISREMEFCLMVFWIAIWIFF